MIRLTGSQNSIVKEVRSLRNKKARDEKGLYFIEGIRFVEEAVKEHSNELMDIRYIIVSDAFDIAGLASKLLSMCKESGINVYSVPDSLFESICDTRHPQGILAVLGLKRKLLKGADLKCGILVILDNVRDPGNMGTIIRTADAAGCAGVIVSDGCVDLFNPKVLRSTMGSVFHIPVYHCRSTPEAMALCKEKGFLLCASFLEGSVSIYDADLSGDVALVVGSEADGIGNETVNAAEILVRIPMAGKAESLNASVAAGIMIFEAVRQGTAKLQSSR